MTLRIVACLTLLLLLDLPLYAATPEARQRQIERFVQEMVSTHHFEHDALSALLGKAHFKQSIIDAMNRPAEAKPWYEYRPIFLTRERIDGGVRYWRRHRDLLQAAEKRYGVPPQIVVAIIGVESRYGNHTGKFHVLEALSTLAFGYPKRADFFRNELAEFLLLAREEKIDPATTKGSYAGAMGKPQFIASSYRQYAVDFDGDHKRDLWNSDADVIASVANYFKRHGWTAGDLIATRARYVTRAHRKFIEAGMKPSIPVKVLRRSGIRPVGRVAPNTLASLIELEQKNGRHEYWLGLPNFYTITRYNHSNLYAMAVYQLSEEIKARKEKQEKGVVTK